MAGFDFSVSSDDACRSYFSALLRMMQGEASKLRLKLRYSWNRKESEYYVTVDGPLRSMQAMMSTTLQKLAAAASMQRSGLTKRRRLALAHRLAKNYVHGLRGIVELVHDVAAHFASTPNSYFLASAADDVNERLFEYSWLLGRFHNDEARPGHVLEQSHTILELLLNRVVARRRLSFSQLTAAAQAQGAIDATDAAAFERLKDVRKKVKHRGASTTPQEVGELIHDALPGIHALCNAVPA